MREKRGTPGHRALLRALIAARIEKDLTQAELAEKLQVRQSFVSNFETGERRLDVVELILVCRELRIDASNLVRRVSRVVATSPPVVTVATKAAKGGKSAKIRKGPRKLKAG